MCPHMCAHVHKHMCAYMHVHVRVHAPVCACAMKVDGGQKADSHVPEKPGAGTDVSVRGVS